MVRARAASYDVDKQTTERKPDTQTGVIADLLDLQFELDSIQQGIHQMDKITPHGTPSLTSNYGFVKADPFGDSFANMKVSKACRVLARSHDESL